MQKFNHYTEAIDIITELKETEQDEELEKILKWCVESTEREDKTGVAPYYYEELAKLYRRQKDYQGEVAILERFSEQPHGPGVKPQKLLQRLEKARAIAARSDV
jgi:hypothetical protein